MVFCLALVSSSCSGKQAHIVIRMTSLGADSQQVEALITEPVEEALIAAKDVIRLKSKSSREQSVIAVEMEAADQCEAIRRVREIVGEVIRVRHLDVTDHAVHLETGECP
jgi:Cu/Ag efflux pump CusA